VSFIDPEGIEHAVEVAAASLYEAAVLALAEIKPVGTEVIFGEPINSPGARRVSTSDRRFQNHTQVCPK
jgi:hypothetical protein